MDNLTTLRRHIDETDKRIVALIAERMEIVRAIGKLKKQEGIAPLDQTRWREVLERRMAQGAALDLDPELIKAVYETFHKYALLLEEQP